MEKQDYWFKCIGKKTPVAVHWKGKVIEAIPVILSAVWIASLGFRFLSEVTLKAFRFLVFLCWQHSKE